jgi:dTDP-4-dehydrorhamnose reductase
MLGDTGLFYKLDVNALCSLFKKVTDNPALALELGQKAGQRAMLTYNWDRIAYEYFKIVRRLSQKTSSEISLPIPSAGNGPKKVLMTGAGGMLGQAMFEQFSKEYIVKATDIDLNERWLSYLDVRDFASYEKMVKSFQPDYIFHLAAMTSLEECDKNLAAAYATNALSVKYAAILASRYNAKLVYISSAGVFDGKKDYYTENDEPNPINTYALTKQMGALFAKYYAKDLITLRPGWMMGGGPRKDKKFISHIVGQLISGQKEIYAVTDKLGTPSYTHDIARNLDLLLRHNANGLYHAVCGGFSSRYDVAKEIVKSLGYDKMVRVIPVTSDYFSGNFTSNRPVSENLVNERLDRENRNLMRPWKQALRDYLSRDYAYAYMENEKEVLSPKLAQAI